MKTFRTAVIAVLLAIWSFPAVSLAAPPPSAASRDAAGRAAAATQKAAAENEATEMAQREQQAPDLQDFRGGAVYRLLRQRRRAGAAHHPDRHLI